MHADYWNGLADTYQSETQISTDDFHFGPLLPGNQALRLLPENLQGLRCLELACGAGQNSLYLASQGAECLAMDISSEQLAYGKKLAKKLGVSVEFHLGDIDALHPEWQGFDLIHSAYGIPFASDPETLIQECATRLNPGGTLLISMGHPVYAGEWLELDDAPGIFMQNYFHPNPDVREGLDHESAQARAFPISACAEWMCKAGLQITALREPPALPVHTFTPTECKRNVPYYSKAWAEQVHELMRFPIVVIYKACKPAGPNG
jgi:SAM-dependent methyltransferase